MSNYVYPQTSLTFEARDALAEGDPEKIIKGDHFHKEFTELQTVSATKMDSNNPTFTGTMTGVNLTLTGLLDVGLIDGGTYSG